MEKGKSSANYYLMCASFLVMIPAVILAIAFINSIFGRLVALVVMAVAVLVMKKTDINVAGNFHEFSAMPASKKAAILAVAVLGSAVGIFASSLFGLL